MNNKSSIVLVIALKLDDDDDEVLLDLVLFLSLLSLDCADRVDEESCW